MSLLRKIKILSSPAGNRTPVSRVTGGDTDHYTTEDLLVMYEMYVYISSLYDSEEKVLNKCENFAAIKIKRYLRVHMYVFIPIQRNRKMHACEVLYC